ncbi:hypothetical protein AAC387_Pa01g3527 [Persea americana]
MTMESGGSRKENSYIGFQENLTLGTLIFSRDCLKGFIPVNTKTRIGRWKFTHTMFFSPNVGNLIYLLITMPDTVHALHPLLPDITGISALNLGR